jgi:hypothetical protein
MTLFVFTKRGQGQGSRVVGALQWGNEEFRAVTGGYGRGPLPDGKYEVKIRHAVTGDASSMNSGYVDPLTGQGWFLPLSPTFSTERSGFGIHPDGNLPGTLGCIGVEGTHCQSFWNKWNATALEQRPRELLVITNVALT